MDLRLGDYREVLADVVCQAVICDPPYGQRTHQGRRTDRDGRFVRPGSGWVSERGLDYAHWTPDDVSAFVQFWAPRCKGWFACMTSHDLVPHWLAAYDAAGLYSFAPLAIVTPGSNIRLCGDGPSSWTVWLVVARPKTMRAWGTLPGAYVFGHGGTERKLNPVAGGKSPELMRALVRDYSRPGDLVCDPCAGGGTTLLAAAQTGRRAIGSELDPVTHAKALKRLANTPVTTDLLDTLQAQQMGLL